MIALRKPVRRNKSSRAWHKGFLAMVPSIRQHASIAFRHLDEEAREEAVTEAIANALMAYKRLHDLGKVDVAYPSVLAKYAIAQIYDGRKVGNRLNTREVLAGEAQKRHGFIVERLDRIDKHAGEWIEATIEDRKTPVPEQVAFRCDFPAWLATQPCRNRRIAEALALGNSTSDVARRFRVSAGRVSQLRREFHQSWNNFHGEGTNNELDADAA